MIRKMTVNLNAIRRRAIWNYDSLCKKLNAAIQDKSHDPSIVIDPEEIRKEMEGLRMQLWGMCCIFIEGDETFIDLTEEIDAKGEIATFFPEE